jgi:hypothetical protein
MLPSGDDARRRASPAATAAACPQCGYQSSEPAAGAPVSDTADPGWLAHLYHCQGLSTYAVAELTGIDRQRVTRILRKAGAPPHPRGAGRARPERGAGTLPDLPRLMRGLYEDAGLSSRQIAAVLGMPERTVRSRLRRYGVRARTRGGWNREDRSTVPGGVLEVLYVKLGMTAAEVGERLGVSTSNVLRSAHALGVPVRSGGVVPVPGPEEIELISALYADPLIDAVLTANGISRVPTGGSLSQRFPVPVPLTTPLVKDLYWGCGTGLNHIELLTGQPAESIRRFMWRAGIPLRHPGGRTPFLRRWRSGAEPGPFADNSGAERAARSAVRTHPGSC